MPNDQTRAARVKLNTDWDSAIGEALKAKPPADGWPKPKAMPQRAHKTKKPRGAKPKG